MMGDADSSVCPPKEKTDSDENLEDVYYFESDNLALKGNRDYGLLLRTVAVLEAQRQKAIEELDTLHSAHREALQDPIAFVDKLQRGVDLKLPKRQKIASLPQINWEQYTSNANLVNMGLHKHMTRLKKSATESTEVGFGSSTLSDNVGESGVTVVRGRVKDERKSSTFNQLWTVDEQRRLEELLTQYPPEEVEAKRWQKIATALGNRTLQQVASRVQKYFIKLAKAGLPIPGKVPNVGAHSKKAAHRHHRFQRFYQQPSTFMSSHEPPVYMSDDDDGYSYSGENSMDTDCGIASRPNTIVPFNDISDDETIPEYLRESDEYQELLQLKRIHAQKLQGPGYCKTRHFGFKCDKCECDPIVGVRWHCLDCPTESSIDFCEECVDSPFDIGRHNSSHRLEPVRDANAQTGHIDQDYTRFVQPGNYNYLDPNYMPAT